MLLIVFFMLAAPFSALAVGGTDDVQETPTRVPDMGLWERIDNEASNWPVGVDPDNCDLMYREDEWVVFHRIPGTSVDVWSYFVDNETWLKRVTYGSGPDTGISNRGFTSDQNGSTAYFFGGASGSWTRRDDFDIFHYDTMTWESRSVPSSLTPRYYPSLTYDNATDSIWVFGGRAQSDTSDLHQFNFTDGWGHPTPATTPGTRHWGAFTASSDGKDLYVALGRYRTSGWRWRYDFWEYNVESNTWAELDSDLRDDGVVTNANGIFQYVNETDDIVLSMGFGDEDEDLHLHQTYRLNRYNGTVTKVKLNNVPPRRISAWDILPDGKTVAFLGGIDGPKDGWMLDLVSLNSNPMPFAPTLLDGTTYTGFDPEDGGKLTVLRVHSVDYDGTEDDYSSWQLAYFSIADGEWHKVEINTTVEPQYHQGMSGCYDPVGNHFYLYGGLDRFWYYDDGWKQGYLAHYKEFWRLSLDDGKWEQLLFNPPQGERAGAALVCDAENRMIYSFGGNISTGGVDSTLARYDIDQARWDLITPTGGPPGPRKDGKMAMHPGRNGLYLYGGRDADDYRSNMLWFLDIGTSAWQQLQILIPGGVAPNGRADHAICVIPDTDEVMILGDPDGDDGLFLWRPFVPWTEWKDEALPPEVSDISDHGMFYSEETGTVFVFLGSGKGMQVMEYSPILRTSVSQVRLYGPDGLWSNDAYPTVGAYEIFVNGVTDEGESDLLGMNLWLNGGGVNGYVNLTKAGGLVDSVGDWFEVIGTPTFNYQDGKWNVSVSLEFNFNMVDGGDVDVTATPVTSTTLSESGRTAKLFQMHSELVVVGYRFGTDLQFPAPFSHEGYLFGNTNLTVNNITVAFNEKTNMHPQNQSLVVSLFNGVNDTAFWEYVKGEEGVMTVPIRGRDNEIVPFVLALSTSGGEELWNQTFNFKLDLDPPAVPAGISLRADSITDDRMWVDNDNEMFLTWDGVVELGSGLKGVCYSFDKNLYPAESNLTAASPKTIISIVEGVHTIYIWAIDKAGRVGPLFQHEVIVDTHLPIFANQSIPDLINITYTDLVVGISTYDELSGVDPGKVEYKYTLPGKQYSDWVKVPMNISGAPGEWERISVQLDLVPGIKNYVIFRIKDRAGSDWKESIPMAIFCQPDLALPTISVNMQNNNTILEDVGSTSPLSWDADYINPDNLTYVVEMVGPDGEARLFDETDKGMGYAPLEPGKYRWWVTANADGLSARSMMMAFTFEPEFALVDMPTTGQIPYGSEVEMVVNVVNGLEMDAGFTMTIAGGNGLLITGGDVFTVPAGGEFNNTLIINGSAAPEGGQSVKLLLTDEFGRSTEYTLTITVLAAPEVADDPVPEEDSNMLLIIAAIVGLIVIIAIIAFIVSRKKEEEKEDDEPEEEIPDYDDEYDPTGMVVEGGTGSEHTILTPPGMLGGEDELRARGSNALELTIPSEDDDVEKPRKRKASTRKAVARKRTKTGRRKVKAPDEIKTFTEGDLEEYSEDDLEEIEEVEELEEFEE